MRMCGNENYFEANDAAPLVRFCQFPAMRKDPLRKIMFPQAESESYTE